MGYAVVFYAGLAWLVAALCVAVVYGRARRLSRVELPSSDELVERALAEDAEVRVADRDAVRRVVLDELVGGIDRETRLGAEWARALARVSLASGTALSLLGMIEQPKGREWLGIAASFLAGAAGTAGTAFVGRLADAQARRIREHWSAAVRRARNRLESS